MEAKVAGWTRYYEGEITRVNSDGTYDILFDDGERKSGVRDDQINGNDDRDDSRSGSNDSSRFCSTGGSIHLVRTQPFTSYIPLNKSNKEIKTNEDNIINDIPNEDKNTLIK